MVLDSDDQEVLTEQHWPAVELAGRNFCLSKGMSDNKLNLFLAVLQYAYYGGTGDWIDDMWVEKYGSLTAWWSIQFEHYILDWVNQLLLNYQEYQSEIECGMAAYAEGKHPRFFFSLQYLVG